MASFGKTEGGIPYMALGNNEPLPDMSQLPVELVNNIKQGRRDAGWCDHGNELGYCPEGCA